MFVEYCWASRQYRVSTGVEIVHHAREQLSFEFPSPLTSTANSTTRCLVDPGAGRASLQVDRDTLGRLFVFSDGKQLRVSDDPWELASIALASGAVLSASESSRRYFDESPVREFVSVPYGEVIEVTATGWSAVRGDPAERFPREELACTTQQQLLTRLRTVTERLKMIPGDVVAFVSGGLDSAITAALAAEVLGRNRLQLVHLKLPGKLRSWERELARRLARELGVTYDEWPLSVATYAPARLLNKHLFAHAWLGWGTEMQIRAVRDGMKVALLGIHGDVFAGRGVAPATHWLAAAGRRPRLAMPAARGWAHTLRGSPPSNNLAVVRPGYGYVLANSRAGLTVPTFSPFCDEPVLATAAAAVRGAAGLEKSMLRDVARRILPREVAERARVPSRPHPARWLGSSLSRLALEQLSNKLTLTSL